MIETMEGKLNKEDDFLLPEVRCGFYIPTAMKQAWAADLQVLKVVDEICKKHNISYFADWGTLLGAVRHAGFIPWDDDLDICMKREDYIKFCEVSKTELPMDFCMHRYDTQDDFWLFLARVVSKDRICYEPDHLRKYHGFPYMASVDIFVLDYMYADEKKEQERREKLLFLLAVGEEIISGKRHAKDSAIKQNLDEAEKRLGRTIPRSDDDHQQTINIYRIVEDEFGSVPVSERGDLTQMMPWGLKGKGFILPSKYYERAIRLPFENTTMPVPYAYDAMLKRRYGNYLTPIKNAGGHDYPFFEGQKRALQEVLDFEIPEYKFEKEILLRDENIRDQIKNASAKNVIREALIELMSLQSDLASAQQVAVDIGNYIEQIWGTDHQSISIIENFCEEIYELFENKKGNPNLIFSSFVTRLNTEFLDKKDVVFLCDSKDHFSAFDHFINKEKADGNDVTIIELNLYKKDYDGRVIIPEDEDNYALELRNPDRIYIQNPYDDTDPCLSINPELYSRIIRYYTDELIYVSPFNIPDFDKSFERDYYNLKYYACTPGVTFADKVIVESDQIREIYIEKLTEFSGEEHKDFWKNKICSKEQNSSESKNENIAGRKKLLYIIGTGNIYENPEDKLLKIQKAFGTLTDNKDKIDFEYLVFPERESLPNAIIAVLEKYKDNRVSINDYDLKSMAQFIKKYDAYYGDASPLVPLFQENKKPIMIAE